MGEVLAAILWLLPAQGRAPEYARLIEERAAAHRLDPLLVVALVYRESRFHQRARAGKNYGLMQVRVSRTVHTRFLGQEGRLYHPGLNIRLGTALLAFWRRYHTSRCPDADHPWWSHYQWGRKVGDRGSGDRVGVLYKTLVARFRGHGEV